MAGIRGTAPHRHLLALLILAALLAPAWALDPPAAPRLAVTVAFPSDIPPGFSLDSQGRPQGFGRDLMEEVAKRAGLELTYLVVPTLAEAIAAVRQGQAQVIPSLAITPARAELFHFSAPLMDSHTRIFMLAEAEVGQAVDLGSLKVGAVAQSSAEEALMGQGGTPRAVFRSQLEALMALLGGRVEALVAQERQILALARRAKVDHLIKTVGQPVLGTHRALAVVKDRPDLARRLDPVVERLVITPEYQRLCARWYGQPPPFWSRSRIVLAMSVLLALVVIAMAAWRFQDLSRMNRSLRQAVAQREKAQDLAQAKVWELQLILDAVPAGIWFKDAENRFLRVNPAAAAMIGRPLEQIEGRHARAIFPTWLADKYHQDDLDVIAHLRPKLNLEEQYVRADGTLGWSSTSKVPWQDQESERFGVLAFSLDITRRKEVEEALRQAHGQLEERVRQRTAELEAANQALRQEMAERRKAEESLVVSFAALQSSITPIVLTGLDGAIQFVNRAALKTWGYQGEGEVLGRCVVDFIHDQGKAALAIRAVLERGSWKGELLCRRRGGGVFPVKVEASAVNDLSGRPFCFMVSLEDLTEVKRAEQEILTSRARLQHLLTATPAVIYSFRPQGDFAFTFVGDNVRTVLGYQPPELLVDRRQWLERIHPQDRPGLKEFSALWQGPREISQRYRFLHKDGSHRWLRDEMKLVTDEQGRPLEVVGCWVDITEGVAADEAARQSRETLVSALSASPVCIAFVNDRVITWVNPAASELSGYPKEELEGQPVRFLYSDESEYGRVGRMFYPQLAGGESAAVTTRLRRKDGTVIDVYLQARMRDPQDASQGVVLAATDISERKQTEEALLAYQRQLRRLIHEINVTGERERRRIASDLHDGLGQDLALLRIKLQAILGARQRPGKRGLRELLAMVDKALREAKALTWDLSAPMLRELGLAAALDWLAEQIKEKYGVPATFVLAGQPQPLDQTQADSLFRMARELSLNAVRHSHCGHVKISLSFNEKSLTLVVEDDGEGFDATGLEGSLDKGGFGLFNIRGLMDAMQGMAKIESWPGRGTKVALIAPLPICS